MSTPSLGIRSDVAEGNERGTQKGKAPAGLKELRGTVGSVQEGFFSFLLVFFQKTSFRFNLAELNPSLPCDPSLPAQSPLGLTIGVEVEYRSTRHPPRGLALVGSTALPF